MLAVQTMTSAASLQIGRWRVRHASSELGGPDGDVRRLEPKVMDVLLVLAERPGEVLWREELFQRLWPGMVVGEDTLARTVSKLRRALGDDVRAPQYIETIAKRGYRLIAPVTAAVPDRAVTPPASPPTPSRFALRGTWLLAGAILLVLLLGSIWQFRRPAASVAPGPDLVARADDYYFQYTRADNAAAIALYQRVLAQRPDHAPALAGLANALVQQRMRWPEGAAQEYRSLGAARAAGHLETAESQRVLQQALQLARRAVALAPELAAAHKALGLVHSASGALDAAHADYARALALDPEAWGPLINQGDLLEIQGRAAAALPYFERAYAAMARAYPSESARIRPWHANLGTLIGDRYRVAGDAIRARHWYQRVLEEAPDHAAARAGLAALE